MKSPKSQRLGQLIRARREQIGMSGRQLAKAIDVPNSTVVRIERGEVAAPTPDKLARLAEALELNLADVYALADYAVPDELPSFQPYLRSKYRDLPDEAVSDLNEAFERVIRKHGYDPAGPQPGEDEAA